MRRIAVRQGRGDERRRQRLSARDGGREAHAAQRARAPRTAAPLPTPLRPPGAPPRLRQRDRDSNPLADEGVQPLDPWYVLEFKRPGIQNGVFRKLKQGRYPAEARLDLHRMSVARARREIYEFISECHALGLRSVLVVHGKGDRQPDRRPRSACSRASSTTGCASSTRCRPSTAPSPEHGGTGAVYVLLAKSEEKKQENRERFMRGRVPYEHLIPVDHLRVGLALRGLHDLADEEAAELLALAGSAARYCSPGPDWRRSPRRPWPPWRRCR
jgi:DNA-nicking Smr family endonuclease